MISQETIATLYGAEVHDRNDEKVGMVGQVYTAEEAGQPAWVSVRTGWFGQRESLVPLEGAQWEGGQRLRVPYEKSQIKAAPHVDVNANEPIEPNELVGLYQHYNLQPTMRKQQQPQPPQQTRTEVEVPGEEALTVSEEQMHVGTERQEIGKARLHKYVVTEPVQTTVPVRHEEVHLEREPISAEASQDRPYSGAEIGEAEREVILHAERPVVAKETVPVERIRLDVDEVTEQEKVAGEVRKERVEANVPEETRRR